MQKDIISAIFKKSKVTGDDVGRLLIADMAKEMIALVETGKVKSTFTQADFDRMLEKIRGNEYQLNRYNLHVHLYNSIKGTYQLTNMVRENAINKVKKYTKHIRGVQADIERILREDSLPLIMTQKQYDKAFEEVFNKECESKYSYLWLFMCAVQYYLTNYEYYQREGNEYNEKTPKKDKQADALIKQYQSEPVKCKELLEVFKDRYEEDNYIVNYYFKDTGDIIPEDNIKLIEELNNRGIPNLYATYPIKLIEEGVFLHIDEPTYNNIERFVTEENRDKYFDTKVTYKQYEQPITKFDILDLFFMFGDYEDDILEGADTEASKEIVHRFNLILKELPELKDFITGKLKAYKNLAQYTPKKDIDLLKLSIPYKVLYDNDVCVFKNYVKITFRKEHYRARNGVAIINEDFIKEYEREDFISPEGDYIQQEANCIQEGLTKRLKEDLLKGNIQIDADIYKDVRFINAYNAFIDITAKVLKIPDLEIWHIGTEDIEGEVKSYNIFTNYLLSSQLKDYMENKQHTDATALKESILNTFPFIDLNTAKITPENYQKGLDYVSDINNFERDHDPTPIYILQGIEIKQ